MIQQSEVWQYLSLDRRKAAGHQSFFQEDCLQVASLGVHNFTPGFRFFRLNDRLEAKAWRNMLCDQERQKFHFCKHKNQLLLSALFHVTRVKLVENPTSSSPRIRVDENIHKYWPV